MQGRINVRQLIAYGIRSNGLNAFKNINSNVAALVCEEEEYALNLDVKKSDNDQIPSKISISFQKGCRTVLKMGSRILSFTLIFWSLVIALRYNFSTLQMTRETPKPTQFFPNSTLVKDFFDGDGANPSLLMTYGEIIVVMFYAPWNLKSKEAKMPFLQTSLAFSHLPNVKFIAVNCHYHAGECKKAYKIYSYPVIFAYVASRNVIIYNQPILPDRLFSWILHLISPLKMIKSIDDFNLMISSYNFAVLGFITLKSNSFLSKELRVFSLASQKLGASHQFIAFGVILNSQIASQLNITETNHLKLFTHRNVRQPFEYNLNDSSKSSDVVKWIETTASKSWDSISELNLGDLEFAGKSETLFNTISSSFATLVLFTTNFGLSLTKVMTEFREVASDCNSNSKIKNESALDLSNMEHSSLEKLLLNSKIACSIHSQQIETEQCCGAVANSRLCRTGHSASVDIISIENFNAINPPCSNLIRLLGFEVLTRRCCMETRSISYGTTLTGWRWNTMCHFYSGLLKRNHSGALQKYQEFDPTIQENCFSDTYGKSLSFLVVDERLSKYFMRIWNAPDTILNSNKNALAIVVQERERIFWSAGINGELTRKHMQDLIRGAISNTLSWNNLNQSLRRRHELIQSPSSYGIFYSIDSINSDIFVNEILEKDTSSYDTIVFFTGGQWMGSSQAVIHILHVVKNYFSQFPSLIRFHILDTSRNELPTAFTPQELPCIGFFPANNPKNNAIFPADKAITVPNLFLFILSRIQMRLRWRLALTACRINCLEENRWTLERSLLNVNAHIRTARRTLGHQKYSSRLTQLQLRPSIWRHYIRRRIIIRLLQTVVSMLDARTLGTDEVIEKKLVHLQ